MQSKRKKKIVFLIIIFIIIMLLLLPKIRTKIMYRNYPVKYDEYIYKYSTEYNIDPLLIFAIIKAESNFKEEVVSKSGAMGLMQLMDKTAEETARKIGLEYNSKEDLYNPEKNIMIGIKYFSTLYERYQNVTLALTAYNAGSGNVDKWIETGVIQKDGTNAENIPFKETNNYVRKILRDYEIYKKLYN